MAIGDNGKDALEVQCCEYAKAERGLGEFGLSVRECGNQSCPQSVFSIPSIYVKCPYRLQYLKNACLCIKVNQKRFLFEFTQDKSR
jgi:hypothetical protein